MKNQKGSPREAGQLILILILIMTVALSIGLSIVQKSLVDISTASKVEQSSRAFSAAEAGVEKALNAASLNCTDTSDPTNCQSFANNASKIAEIISPGLLPPNLGAGSPQPALEFPPLAKEDVAQVWLADFSSASNPPPAFYTQPTLEVFWGDSTTDKAALELTLVYYNGSAYQTRKWYLDHSAASRNPANGFDSASSCGANENNRIGTIIYQCRRILGDNSGSNNGPLPSTGSNRLMLMRIRLLYNTTSQPFAVRAVGSCGTACSLPPAQAKSITSTGASGDTQRTIKLFQLNKVVPTYFDYAIFSAGSISK